MGQYQARARKVLEGRFRHFSVAGGMFAFDLAATFSGYLNWEVKF
jgi:hypothetical protein